MHRLRVKQPSSLLATRPLTAARLENLISAEDTTEDEAMGTGEATATDDLVTGPLVTDGKSDNLHDSVYLKTHSFVEIKIKNLQKAMSLFRGTRVKLIAYVPLHGCDVFGGM